MVKEKQRVKENKIPLKLYLFEEKTYEIEEIEPSCLN